MAETARSFGRRPARTLPVHLDLDGSSSEQPDPVFQWFFQILPAQSSQRPLGIEILFCCFKVTKLGFKSAFLVFYLLFLLKKDLGRVLSAKDVQELIAQLKKIR